jgi:hypothetical protein
MAKFKKPIVSAGVFLVGNGNGGRHTESITTKRLQHWANEFNRMRANGVLVPAPWNHNPNSLPVVMGNNGMLPDSANNAGFWDSLSVETTADGKSTLYGILEAPGDENDFSSPAGKIGKTVKETSIYARPSWVDGKENSYTDSIMHIALVTHPIEAGQGNFEPLNSGQTIAMSHCQQVFMSDDGGSKPDPVSGQPDPVNNEQKSAFQDKPTGDLGTLIEMLTSIGIIIPKDTTDENLKERLSIAVQQKLSGDEEEDEEEGSLRKPPKDAEQQSVPMTMSQTPNQPAVIDSEVIMAHPTYKALSDQNKAMLNVMTNQARNARATRINSLIATKRVSKEYADLHLLPLLNGFQMSFDGEGKENISALDVTLNALEAIPAPQAPSNTPNAAGSHSYANDTIRQLAPFLMSSTAPEGSSVPNHPQGLFSDDLSDGKLEEVGDQFLKNLNLV